MPKRLTLACLFCFCAATFAHAQPTARQETGSYLLALSWSPHYCAQHGRDGASRSQCRGPTAYGFVVHGLWREDGDNASCRPPAPLSSRLLDRMLPIMPSTKLIKHEWTVHGRCSGLSADDYFDRVSQAFLKVQIPDRLQHPADPIITDVTHLKQWFQEANPGLQTGMLTIHCDGRDAALQEIRFCVGQSLGFRSCAPSLTDHCPGGTVRIVPLP